jgi:hypothetical protein
MRRTTLGILVGCALVISGCGGGSTFANKPRPASPVNLTVYVNSAQVSVSPSSVGAGPVAFIVTNSDRQTETLAIKAADGMQTLASTGPINPQATADVTIDFKNPGDYMLSASKSGTTEAAQSNRSSIQAATIRIGPARPTSSSQLLQP